MTRRKVATLGRLSMAAGSTLMVVGLSIRVGVLGAGAQPPSTVPPATHIAAAVTPSGATPLPPTLAPTVPAAPTPGPTEPMVTIFEDTFEQEGAWPTGGLGEMDAAYEGGAYVIAGPATDLPVFIAPTAEPFEPASIVVVEVKLILGAGAAAGVYVGVSDYERIGAVVGPGGRVAIFRDSSVSLDVIGSGSVAVNGPVRLTMTIDGATVSAAVEGQLAVSVAMSTTVLDAGLVTWPTGESTVNVSRFAVVASPPD